MCRSSAGVLRVFRYSSDRGLTYRPLASSRRFQWMAWTGQRWRQPMQRTHFRLRQTGIPSTMLMAPQGQISWQRPQPMHSSETTKGLVDRPQA